MSCRLTYGAGATTGATVNIYYSPDGDNFDTVAYLSFLVDLSAGNTVQESAILDLPEHGYIEVKVSNGNAASTQVQLWYTVARHGDTYVEGDKIVKILEDIHKKLGEVKDILPLSYNLQG